MLFRSLESSQREVMFGPKSQVEADDELTGKARGTRPSAAPGEQLDHDLNLQASLRKGGRSGPHRPGGTLASLVLELSAKVIVSARKRGGRTTNPPPLT